MFTGPNIITDGLVLALDAGNTKSYPGSGTTWNDLSGGGNNGTLVNGPIFDSGNAGSIVFDGVNDWGSIIMNSNSLITNDFTFIAWAKRTANSSTIIGGIFGNHFHPQLSGANMYFSNDANSGNTQVRFSAGNGVTRPAHIVNIPTSNLNWNHYVIRYIGTTYQFYFNGALLDSRTAVVVQSTSSNQFSIGRWAPSFNSYYLNGKISNCMAYNRALTPQEILQNYNATKGRYGL